VRTQAALHGDPRHHADDIAKLKAENERLRTAIAALGLLLRYAIKRCGNCSCSRLPGRGMCAECEADDRLLTGLGIDR
jgi:hypothetical protein